MRQKFVFLKYIVYFCKNIWCNNMKLNRIKVVLDERGISQTWLAKQLGKSYNTVNAYCGNRQQPSLELLNEIAKILSVGIKDLIEENNETAKY